MARTPNQPADFVGSIVTDPKNVPDVMRLYGYPGASSEEGHERLYLSPDLTNYVEVPRTAERRGVAVRADQDPHGAVCWWVKKDAALIYKMAPAAQAMAHYLTAPRSTMSVHSQRRAPFGASETRYDRKE